MEQLKEKKKTIGFDQESYLKIKEYCERRGLKISRFCEQVILNYIKENE